MSSTLCNHALPTNPIPVCIGELTIGTIADFTTNVLVYLMDITINKLRTFQTTSGAAGEIVIDVSEVEFSDKHSYELWVTKSDSQTKETITIDSETATVIGLTFQMPLENNEPFAMPAVTLEAA